MIEPYGAMALQLSFPRIARREDIKKVAIRHIDHIMERSMAGAEWENKVRLVALTEGGLSGWTAEMTLDHLTFCRQMALESVPGEETEALGELAKKYNTYIAAVAKAMDRDIIDDRYFNIAFLIDPRGKVILKHYKLQTITNSCSVTPSDVWDKYVAKFGDGLDAFFQVADTDIGKIGLTICFEGSFPEIARGFALCGAEVLIRPSYGEPYSSGGPPGWWEIQNRARALDNCLYMVCPNDATRYPDETSYNMSGGYSMVIDYRGQVLSVASYGTEGFACAPINIEALRYQREKSRFGNWLPFLRTEVYRRLYEKPIYPPNRWLREPPPGLLQKEPETIETLRKVIRDFQNQGIFVPPDRGKK